MKKLTLMFFISIIFSCNPKEDIKPDCCIGIKNNVTLINLDTLEPKRNTVNWTFWNPVTNIYDSKDLVSNKSKKVFLIYGQSNAGSHSECYVDEIDENVLMFSQNIFFNFKEPMIGTTGDKCSPWGLLGNLFIENQIVDQVIFANNSVGGFSLEKLVFGESFDVLKESINGLCCLLGKIDGIIIHQGEANHEKGLGSDNYFNDFVFFSNEIKRIDSSLKIFLSRASYCQSYSDSKLIKIQDSLINQLDNVYYGPNTDKYINERFDDCHFSQTQLKIVSEEFYRYLLNPINKI
jgi:hypothetical protein